MTAAAVSDYGYGLWFLVVVNTAVILLQWPTIPTLLMFPVLLLVYRHLAIREEEETRERFGSDWDVYAARTPRFIPRLRAGRRRARSSPAPS